MALGLATDHEAILLCLMLLALIMVPFGPVVLPFAVSACPFFLHGRARFQVAHRRS